MRSVRILLATAAATAAFVIATPGAHAAGGDWNNDDSSYSKEEEKGTWSDSPRGGMHTGGGALTAVSEGDWGGAQDPKHDPETYKDAGYGKESGKESGKEWSKEEQDKPRGGMHTGGGGLDAPGVTAGGLAVLVVAATGVYAMRRRKTAESVA